MDKMKEIPFIVPPADEQLVIVEYIKKALPKYDEAIEKLTAEVSVLEEYKAKLIADVVTGKVDVRGIEIPDYEFVAESIDEEMEEADCEE
jgi:type I restriction enzyme S subunit